MDSKTVTKTNPLAEKTAEQKKIGMETAAWLHQHPNAGAVVVRITFTSICRQNGQLPGSAVVRLLALSDQDKARLLTAVAETSP